MKQLTICFKVSDPFLALQQHFVKLNYHFVFQKEKSYLLKLSDSCGILHVRK